MLKTSTDQRGLLANMNVIAQAPGGVARLRELILTLAVKGKLVPQDASDEPASELLKKIWAEKDRLIAEGKIKKDKPLAEITEEEKPFELPVGWEWVRLGKLAELITSGSRDWAEYYSNTGAVFLRMGNLSKGSYQLRLNSIQYVTPPGGGEGSRTRLIEGDLLLSITGDVGMLGLIPKDFGEAYINQHTCLIRWIDLIRNEFFPIQMLSHYLQKQMNEPQRGVKNSFRLSDVSTLLLALPPLTEQSRIVARVEELMRLCDALEEKGRLEHTQHQQLLQAMLDSLTQTTDAQELARHWQRLAQHFDLLIDRPEAVDALEQTILQLAVRGLLVPQDPSDEPASELLKKIRAEKDRLIAEGKVKKDKPLPAIEEDEKPFELPVGWEWVRLGNVGITKTGGTPSSSRSENFGGEFPFIGPGQITLKGEILPPEKFISKIGSLESEIAEPNDILMVCIGGSIGKCATANYLTAFNQQINAIHPIYALNDYVLFAMKSGYFFSAVIAAATGSATPIISKGKWDQLLLPISPLAEQSRIVARVTELRTLCQQLRDKLTQARHTQTQLAQVWVEQVAA